MEKLIQTPLPFKHAAPVLEVRRHLQYSPSGDCLSPCGCHKYPIPPPRGTHTVMRGRSTGYRECDDGDGQGTYASVSGASVCFPRGAVERGSRGGGKCCDGEPTSRRPCGGRVPCTHDHMAGIVDHRHVPDNRGMHSAARLLTRRVTGGVLDQSLWRLSR